MEKVQSGVHIYYEGGILKTSYSWGQLNDLTIRERQDLLALCEQGVELKASFFGLSLSFFRLQTSDNRNFFLVKGPAGQGLSLNEADVQTALMQDASLDDSGFPSSEVFDFLTTELNNKEFSLEKVTILFCQSIDDFKSIAIDSNSCVPVAIEDTTGKILPVIIVYFFDSQEWELVDISHKDHGAIISLESVKGVYSQPDYYYQRKVLSN